MEVKGHEALLRIFRGIDTFADGGLMDRAIRAIYTDPDTEEQVIVYDHDAAIEAELEAEGYPRDEWHRPSDPDAYYADQSTPFFLTEEMIDYSGGWPDRVGDDTRLSFIRSSPDIVWSYAAESAFDNGIDVEKDEDWQAAFANELLEGLVDVSGTRPVYSKTWLKKAFGDSDKELSEWIGAFPEHVRPILTEVDTIRVDERTLEPTFAIHEEEVEASAVQPEPSYISQAELPPTVTMTRVTGIDPIIEQIGEHQFEGWEDFDEKDPALNEIVTERAMIGVFEIKGHHFTVFDEDAIEQSYHEALLPSEMERVFHDYQQGDDDVVRYVEAHGPQRVDQAIESAAREEVSDKAFHAIREYMHSGAGLAYIGGDVALEDLGDLMSAGVEVVHDPRLNNALVAVADNLVVYSPWRAYKTIMAQGIAKDSEGAFAFMRDLSRKGVIFQKFDRIGATEAGKPVFYQWDFEAEKNRDVLFPPLPPLPAIEPELRAISELPPMPIIEPELRLEARRIVERGRRLRQLESTPRASFETLNNVSVGQRLGAGVVTNLHFDPISDRPAATVQTPQGLRTRIFHEPRKETIGYAARRAVDNMTRAVIPQREAERRVSRMSEAGVRRAAATVPEAKVKDRMKRQIENFQRRITALERKVRERGLA